MSFSSTQSMTNDYANEQFENILNLKLKKPKHWHWELSTSRSCTNIALPRIVLFDHKGHLLADTKNEDKDQIISSKHNIKNVEKAHKAATCNLMSDIYKVLEHKLEDLCITENVYDTSSNFSRSPVHSLTPQSIDFRNFIQSPNKSRSNSLTCSNTTMSDGRKLSNISYKNESSLNSSMNMQKSTSTTSSSNGMREKRRQNRGNSRTNSILERFSMNKGRYSSPEYALEEDVHHAPQYYLVSSKAGTLVVQKESFSRYRRRQRLKHSSCENVQSQSVTAQNSFVDKKKSTRSRDYDRSEFPTKLYFSSEENLSMKRPTRKLRRHGQHKNDVVIIDPDNSVMNAQERPTAR